jgi:hypothetical protein
LLGVGLFSLWASSFFVQRAVAEPNPERLRTWAPLAMFAFCLAGFLQIKPDQGIPFQPAEVDFLFAGPFRRRDLLAYRIAGNLLQTLPTALIFSLFLLPHVRWWICGFVGLFVGLAMIQLMQMAALLVAATVAQHAFTRVRRLVLLLGGVAVAAGIVTALKDHQGASALELARRFRDSGGGRVVLAPFEVVGRTIGAESVGNLIGWAAVALGINGLLAILVIGMDAHFMEASVEATRRLSERRERARKGRLYGQSKTVGSGRFRVPLLPRWKGAGPIAWQQLTAVSRSGRSILWLLVILAVSFGIPGMVTRSKSEPMGGEALASMLAPLAIFSLMFLPQLLRYDFRGDFDRLDLLKTLPMPATSLVIGQLLAPVLLMTAVQVFFLGLFAARFWELHRWLLLALAFSMPLNLLVFATENVLFLLYPQRLVTGGHFDFQQMAGHVLMLFVKVLIWGLCTVALALVAALVYWFTGGSMVMAAASAWLLLTGLGVGLIPVLASAFRRLDPSIDLPP